MIGHKQYLIKNTTVKPVRLDPVTKKDTRSVVEKFGHAVQWRDSHDKVVTLGVSHPGEITTDIGPGLLGLMRDGYVSITQINDIGEVLALHAKSGKRTQRRGVKKDAPVESLDRSAKAVEMGTDDYKQPSGNEYEGAVNPSGDPNFLVRAPSRSSVRKTRAKIRSEEAAT